MTRNESIEAAARAYANNMGHGDVCDLTLYGEEYRCDCGYSALRSALAQPAAPEAGSAGAMREACAVEVDRILVSWGYADDPDSVRAQVGARIRALPLPAPEATGAGEKCPTPPRAEGVFVWLLETSDQSHQYLVEGRPGHPAHMTANPWEATRFVSSWDAALKISTIGTGTLAALGIPSDLRPVEHGFAAPTKPPAEGVEVKQREFYEAARLVAEHNCAVEVAASDNYRIQNARDQVVLDFQQKYRALLAAEAEGGGES